jgi:hypothetical protein
MKTFIKGLIITGLIVVGFWGLIELLNVGMDKEEQVICYKLQSQALQYPDYWITLTQKEMCDYHGIFINAPVFEQELKD